MKEPLSIDELNSSWHRRCMKSFFGTQKMPVLDISNRQMEKLAVSMTSQGFALTGVQKKLSLHLSKEKHACLTIVDYPAGYILKPQTEEYAYLPEFEALSMKMAQISGIRVVPCALIRIGNDLAYITKRIDRKTYGDDAKMLAMEDFCQLSYRLTQDKYRGSYEGCGRIIRKYSERVGLDLSELFMRVIFSFITGNSDMHLKNFSLIESEPGNREYVLSAAYDMLPVNIILPEDREEFALTLNGKKKNVHKKDFYAFAGSCGIEKSTAEKMIKKLCNYEQKYYQCCRESFLPEEMIERTIEMIQCRIARLQ